ncbi:hypothetical protein [Rhizobium sp. AAP43]|uniref:hypothetical protein n=1 Tax=Rhizobium sp. AAP43 TaxID=1523420 RepID=UPI000AC1AC10|nr:hypothetical protein [Rhizobium sp. AAP43]
MKSILPLLALALLILPLEAQAQTATPMPAKVETRLDEACGVQAPQFIEAVCQDKGVPNLFVLNLPGICAQYGKTDKIQAAVAACTGSNVYADLWKYKFGQTNGFLEHFKSYIAAIREHESEGENGSALTAPAEAFRMSVLACGLDAKCHRELYDALGPGMKAAFARTPYFCDYGTETSFNDAGYRDQFFDIAQPGGIAQPMCRAYYCQNRSCDTPAADAGPFILSEIFVRQYDMIYKAIKP